jgi:hypothetical protein
VKYFAFFVNPLFIFCYCSLYYLAIFPHSRIIKTTSTWKYFYPFSFKPTWRKNSLTYSTNIKSVSFIQIESISKQNSDSIWWHDATRSHSVYMHICLTRRLKHTKSFPDDKWVWILIVLVLERWNDRSIVWSKRLRWMNNVYHLMWFVGSWSGMRWFIGI